MPLPNIVVIQQLRTNNRYSELILQKNTKKVTGVIVRQRLVKVGEEERRRGPPATRRRDITALMRQARACSGRREREAPFHRRGGLGRIGGYLLAPFALSGKWVFASHFYLNFGKKIGFDYISKYIYQLSGCAFHSIYISCLDAHLMIFIGAVSIRIIRATVGTLQLHGSNTQSQKRIE